jgi:hypothetical protein
LRGPISGLYGKNSAKSVGLPIGAFTNSKFSMRCDHGPGCACGSSSSAARSSAASA